MGLEPAVMTATFHEAWFPTQSQDSLARLVKLVRPLDGLIVEVGAWEGRSTIAMAAAAWPRIVHTIDTWKGSPGEVSGELAATRDVYEQFRTNIDASTRGNVEVHRCGWRDWLPQVDQPIALCFIDAEHTYTEVYDTIQCVLPKMVDGGIICGDDAHHEPVARAVMELLGDERVYVDATLWIWQKWPEPTSLKAMYEQRCATPSDIYLHLPRFVQLVEALNAEHVIELGSRSGVSTVAWLYALEGKGRLTSIDLDKAPDIGAWPHWMHVQGDDTDPALMQVIDPCDILFIDTSHLYDHTLWELRNWSKLVRPGGVIALHDTELPIPEGAGVDEPLYPVKRAVEDFVREKGWEWRNIPECWGLGLIKVGDA